MNVELSLTSVDREEVAMYYIRSEMHNIIKNDSPDFHDFDKQKLWRLLEALSYTYRANGMFHYLSDHGLSWFKAEIPIEAIDMTGMSPVLTELIYSKHIQQNPIRLRDYLLQYFKEHPHDDPKGLNECRPRAIKGGFETIIVRQYRGRIRMLDGSHRFVSQLLAGKRVVDTYLCRSNGRSRTRMMGDTTFLSLRRLYQTATSDVDQEAILRTTELLAAKSSDGRSAIKAYWIAARTSPEVTTAGQQLLERLVKKPKKE